LADPVTGWKPKSFVGREFLSMRMKSGIFVVALLLAAGLGAHETDDKNSNSPDVPEGKRTTLGLHITAQEAYEKWKENQDEVKILDVRTPEEYVFVGHAAKARNIPLMFFLHQWNPERKSPVMKPNPDFVAQVKKHYQPDDTILITCRSGGRSKRAVDLLAKEGFKNVYSIIDGMEGDSVRDEDSEDYGKRTRNGWKNSDAPWTYKLDPELMYLEPEQR
jgi:rhodanese-related sulfurtransferase